MKHTGSSTSPSGEDAVRTRARELAKRLNLLVDVYAADTNQPLSFRTIQAALAERGHSLSQGRWFYMLAGTGSLTTDLDLLAAISEFFHVPAAFLQSWDETDLPTRVEAQLDHVRAIRRDRLTAFATRTLGPLTPEGVEFIERLVTAHMTERPKPTN